MTQKPATQLVTELKSWMNVDDPSVVNAIVPIEIIKKWHGLAKKINASMRLDGSKLSKRKKAAKKVPK